MKLRILLIGRTREEYLQEGIDEYLKRIAPMQKLEWLELPDISITSAGSPENVKAKEAQLILSKLRPEEYVVLLDERGEQKTSLEFSLFLSRLSEKRSVAFVVGGVYGTDSSVHDRADCLLSLSAMTFTHQMVRLFLTEQLYRALMIKGNRSYHY